ncbi:type II toxin-antitoxin system VapC family toxin [Oryzicola mucosus]|uniref:Type II toxin-antitoxin system VapC family toxin n=1 Tax=Oryzicola mucosus TaxID=2767425 RepID=A0A8J6PW11_9HYPH|nr:type II toxin-antitoxin system VapC family toxin [Oryzicola mucosus]MBD0415861.1 type II toxin-antitoxin system VapC family toxin [Oryzicola mucosus]
MAEVVFDASAVLAIAFQEPGAEVAIGKMSGAVISSVNYSEAGAKLIDKGFGADEAFRWLAALRLDVITFDETHARQAAVLRSTTKARRLSFADRACIALTIERHATVVTTDRAWAELDLPCAIELIR